MEELKASRVSVGLHSAAALAAGYIAVLLGLAPGFLAGIILLIVMGIAAKRISGQKGSKWWAKNGLLLYILIWFVSWVYFFNTL
ncbi:MAG: hypothetical protein HY367_01285 [Candidatus Aenigmarchaeota archaeon]|nr:hypothetical protein [Candidatus Aenigmarchaeota archaeon]